MSAETVAERLCVAVDTAVSAEDTLALSDANDADADRVDANDADGAALAENDGDADAEVDAKLADADAVAQLPVADVDGDGVWQPVTLTDALDDALIDTDAVEFVLPESVAHAEAVNDTDTL